MADDLHNVPETDPRTDADPLSDEVRSAVLEDEEGRSYVVDQQNTGAAPETGGGGEYPDPDAPPEPPAPGASGSPSRSDT